MKPFNKIKYKNIVDLERALPEKWTEERRKQYFIWAAKVTLSTFFEGRHMSCLISVRVLYDKVKDQDYC